MAGGMFIPADVQVNVLPIVHSLSGEVFPVVVGVHIAEVISAGSCEPRHSVGLEGISFGGCPVLCPGEGWFPFFGRQVFVHFRQFEGQLVFVQGDRGFRPCNKWGKALPSKRLTAEDRVAQAVVDLAVPPSFPFFPERSMMAGMASRTVIPLSMPELIR